MPTTPTTLTVAWAMWETSPKEDDGDALRRIPIQEGAGVISGGKRIRAQVTAVSENLGMAKKLFFA